MSHQSEAVAAPEASNPGLSHGGDLTGRIISLAVKVHRRLGPGLLEAVYEQCLCHELTEAGLSHQRQAPLPIQYGDVQLDCGYRVDVIVDEQVILEIKSVDAITPLHQAQLLT